MSVDNVLGIPERQVYYRFLCIQKFIGYPSKGSERKSLELRITVCREFIRYPSKAGLVYGSLHTKSYRVSLKGR
jgi:hypothetical protein